jgi:hypothetical protein
MAYIIPDAFPDTPVSVPTWVDGIVNLIWIYYLPHVTEFLWSRAFDTWQGSKRHRQFYAFLFICQFNLIGFNILPICLVLGIFPSFAISILLTIPMWMAWNIYKLIVMFFNRHSA